MSDQTTHDRRPGPPLATEWAPRGAPPAAGAPPGSGPGAGRGGSLAAVVVATVVAVVVIALFVAGLAYVARTDARQDRATQGAAAPTEPQATTAPAALAHPPVPKGYKLVVDDAKGYAFVIPESWTSSTPTAAEIDTAIAAARAKDPSLAATLEQVRAILLKDGLALAVGTRSSATPTAYLLEDTSGTLTAAELAAQSDAAASAIGATVVERRNVAVGGRPGVRVVLVRSAPGSTTQLRQHQLYLDGANGVYVFALAGVPDSVADVILGSLRVR